MSVKFFVAALLSSLSLASYAKSDTATSCAFSDLVGLTVTNCTSTSGNVINSSKAAQATVTSILANTFNVTSPTAVWIEKIDNLNGSKTIDFSTPLSGDTIVALHFGNANQSTNPKGVSGNVTMFYEFNAGTSLDRFTINLLTSSNAAIYLTSPVITPSIPEPESYAMLIAGLGLVGVVARRRKNALK